jgi:hypothetical protein
VGLNTPADAGYVAQDGFGGVFRDNSGNLLTTETPILIPASGSLVKLGGSLLTVQANQTLAAFTLVYLLNGQAAPASSDPQNFEVKAPIAITTQSAYQNQPVTLAANGRIIVNAGWGPWGASQIGLPVFCDFNGNLTLSKPGTVKYVRVGTIVGENAVLLTFDWETNTSLLLSNDSKNVNTVSVTAPLVSSGNALSPTLGITQVSSSQSGYLSSSDYITFKGYEAQIASKVDSTFSNWGISQVVGLQDLINSFVTASYSSWPISSVTGLTDQLSQKASLVVGAAPGNLVGFDSNGNITDSTYNPASFALASTTSASLANIQNQLISINSALNSKISVISGATPGNFTMVSNYGEIVDSGLNQSSFASSTVTNSTISALSGQVSAINAVLSNKLDKPQVSNVGDFISVLANGELSDSGYTVSSFYGPAPGAINVIPQSAVSGLVTSLSSKLSTSGGTINGSLTVSSFSVGSAISIQSSGELDLGGNAGLAGQVLTSGGPGSAPSWSDLTAGSNNSTTITVGSAALNQKYYLPFMAGTSGNQSIFTVNPAIATLSYNPAIDALTVTTVNATLNGNAASATTATTATNLSGGGVGTIPYQTSTGATSQLTPGPAGTVITSTGMSSVPTWGPATGPDMYYGNVGLLMHFEGNPTSNTWIDSSVYGNSFTTVGSVALQSGQHFSGTTSAYWPPSATPSAIVVNSNLNGILDLSLEQQNWTVEYFIYPNNVTPATSAVHLDMSDSGTTLFQLYHNSTGNVVLNSIAGNFTITGGLLNKDAWNHIAVTRYGNTITLFVNGFPNSQTFSGYFAPFFGPIYIGQDPTSTTTGLSDAYIDELRITRGIARYVLAFNIPTGAFPDSSTTGIQVLPIGQNRSNPTTVISGNTTANVNQKLIIDTSAAAITVTLPKSPRIGDEIYFIDGSGTWATNNLTIDGNSSLIMGSASLVVSQNRANFSLIYYNSSQGWIYGV